MKVKLISYSQKVPEMVGYPKVPVVNEDIQELIAYCARVSNPSNQNNQETSGRLLSYLAKHKHWSPFEMVSACLEIETTRDIARQILRHRSFSFQEFSQRYANPVNDLEYELRETRLQDPKNRQNSIGLDSGENVDLIMEWYKKQSEVWIAAKNSYQWAIENGIAKEQARAVLPEGMMKSRLYVNGTIRSWIHFIELRSGNGTQLEHQKIALECAKAITQIFPLAKEFISDD